MVGGAGRAGCRAPRGGLRAPGKLYSVVSLDRLLFFSLLWQVTLWLKKIYGNQPIPQYEVNARTVDILYELVECNEARDRDVSLLIEDMKQKAAEYEAEANYLQGLLAESLDLSLSSLSSEGTSYLNVLVNSAMTLETKDTSLASFFCAINDMTSELYATESKNREMELELTNIRKKLTAALMLEKQLEGDLKKTEERLEVEKAKADSQSQNLKFLKDKSEDLKIRIKAAEEQLAATGLNQSLTHESLVSLSEQLAALQEEIVPLKKKLESYLDLTPNPSLARVKIEEVKRELNALEAEFSKEIDMLTLEMPESSKLRFT
ncbi:PREDICTED: HAUS augmin-like complex subunit 1 [Aptenodytes forsteri]|nr:PREDICTED: HAUS augmin-like complex subunit 1 [Aptenodytes forsteri]